MNYFMRIRAYNNPVVAVLVLSFVSTIVSKWNYSEIVILESIRGCEE